MTTMTDTTTEAPDDGAPYLDAVRTVLATAPESTREELLDDLAGHLAELAAEPGAPPLRDRLGSPDVYAQDLVASIGITAPDPPPAPPPPPPLGDRLRRWWSSTSVVAVRDFLPELRPGWWVLRGYLLVCAFVAADADASNVVPVPKLAGNPVLGLLVAAGAVVASVAIGRRGGRGWNIAATTVGVVAALVTAAAVNERTYVYTDVGATSYGVLTAPDGQPITNIWPYDGAGTPLEGVLLFDQYGRPIDVGATGVEQPGAIVVPGLYPRPQVVFTYDERTGAQRTEPATAPDVSVPRLPTTSTTTTTTTAPSTTVAVAPPSS